MTTKKLMREITVYNPSSVVTGSKKEILINLVNITQLYKDEICNSYKLHVIFCLSILAILLIPITFSNSESGDISQSVYPIDSNPYGSTYGEWTAKWWQWAMSTPTKDNPVTDETGEKCAVSQTDPNVWFLAGTGGGEAIRSCTIPAGKAILIPVLNVECDFLSPDLKTESYVRNCAKADQDKATNLQATVDGVAIPDLKTHRVQSPIFNVTIPKDNVLGTAAGATQAVSDGYWVLLKPLPVGKYQINFSGSLSDFTATGPINFVSDAKYDITVTNP
jgi:hypothetical protein